MKKVFVLALDGAEASLIERWTADNTLPNLRRLRLQGAYGRLASPGDLQSEAVPFCFYTGRSLGQHGAHSFLMWRKETMQYQIPNMEWLPLQPFWRAFQAGGPRAIVLDVATVYAPIPSFNGVEIIGWATHDTLGPFQTQPADLANWLDEHYGSNLLPEEIYGTFDKQEFIRSRDLMFQINRKFSALCTDLIRTEQWNLFLAFNFTVHNAGHRLSSLVNVKGALTEAEKSDLTDTLRQIYISADQAIGALIQEAGPDATIMVISLHGMETNKSRTWVLPDMLRLVLGQAARLPREGGWLMQLRKRIPLEWRHRVKSMLPYSVRRWLTRFWRSGFVWGKTQAFPLISDPQGWIRINLKGRESKGIVEPGEYELLCKQISDGLLTFVDADTGEPVIKAIVRPQELFSGDKKDNLPDLIVQWADSPAHLHRAISSQKFGTIPWPTPGQNPEGRSGNHNSHGFMIAAGPDIAPGDISNADILDLAPTILHLLEQPIPPEMEGKVIQFPIQ